MANLTNPDGTHEQERPEDNWTDRISAWIAGKINYFGYECHSFEFGRNFFRFKDKSGKTITVKITSK